jgi:hypothetical protein
MTPQERRGLWDLVNRYLALCDSSLRADVAVRAAVGDRLEAYVDELVAQAEARVVREYNRPRVTAGAADCLSQRRPGQQVGERRR